MMGETVRIRQAVLDELVAHARRDSPEECCGLLIGTSDRIEEVLAAHNLHARRPRFVFMFISRIRAIWGLRPARLRYSVDPADQFSAIRRARARGLEVVGVYHSHPHSAPVPSITDLREAHDPEAVHLIVFPGSRAARSDVRAYRLAQGNFAEVGLVADA